jgi:hypothetical protein
LGRVAAAGKRILRVCFREITPDCYRQIRGLKISPQKPGNFSKADTENLKFSGGFGQVPTLSQEFYIAG